MYTKTIAKQNDRNRYQNSPRGPPLGHFWGSHRPAHGRTGCQKLVFFALGVKVTGNLEFLRCSNASLGLFSASFRLFLVLHKNTSRYLMFISIRLSVHVSFYRSIRLSIHLSIYLSLSIPILIYLFIHVMHLSVHSVPLLAS